MDNAIKSVNSYKSNARAPSINNNDKKYIGGGLEFHQHRKTKEVTATSTGHIQKMP